MENTDSLIESHRKKLEARKIVLEIEMTQLKKELSGLPKTKDKSTKVGKKMGDKYLAEFKAAGEDGIKISELAKKLEVKNTAIHAWINNTGKKKGIIRISRGVYGIK